MYMPSLAWLTVGVWGVLKLAADSYLSCQQTSSACDQIDQLSEQPSGAGGLVGRTLQTGWQGHLPASIQPVEWLFCPGVAGWMSELHDTCFPPVCG